MDFPIPDFRAEEAARDLASDIRTMAAQAVPLREAMERNEASESDRAKYSELIEQIKSMSDIRFHCQETGEIYQVGDYVTVRRELLANYRRSLLAKGYEKLKRLLLH